MSILVAAVDGMTSHDAGDVTRLETVFLSQEGVVGVTGDDLLVEAQDTPDLTVQVASGSCFVLRDAHADNDNTLKFWKVIVTASENVTIPAADPSNPRIDLICVKIDTGASPDATASNVATLVNVEGTAAGSPSAPAVPNNHLELAQVSVPASDTTIEGGQITDTRTFIGLQLPYAHGYRLKDTAGSLDAQVYESSAGVVIIKGAKSGGSVEIDQVNNKIQFKPGGGTSGVTQTSAVIEVEVFAPTTDNATGDGAKYITIPKKLDGMKLARVHAENITAGITGTEDLQIYHEDNAEDMLLTPITIDTTETGSDTAATPAVIDETRNTVNEHDRLRIDVDDVHSGTAAKGLIMRLEFELP